MSNLVFVSGDFCSGSTLLFTLFRKTGEYYCLYEPLHEKLPEYLIWPLRSYEHHFFVEDYFSEYKGFDKLTPLFNPSWGSSNLYLHPQAEAEGLYRYIHYLVETAFSRRAKIVLQFNRAAFRLGWLRAKFPQAKIVHIYRDKEAQWGSIVRRAQAHLGREDVGQEDVMFNGFNIATWCEDLKTTFPQLDASNFKTGYDRFCKLWDLSQTEHQKYADVSADYWALTHDFETTCMRIWNCVGCSFGTASLKQFVVPPEDQKRLRTPRQRGLRRQAQNLLDKVMRRYASVRLILQSLLRKKIS